MNDQHVLLWSCSQNALHVEPVERMLELNRQACACNRAGDYRPLAMGTRAEAEAAAEKLRPHLIRREFARGQAGELAA